MTGQASFRNQLLIALGQVTLIVLSVVLAFMANRWQQHAEDEALAAQAIEAMQIEFTTNRETVQAAVEYRRGVLARIDSGGAGGQMRPAFITGNAWMTAVATNALQQLPFELVVAAGNVHETQEAYSDAILLGALIGYFSNLLDDESLSHGPDRVYYLLEDMYTTELNLIRRYDAALALIDSLSLSTP